MEIDQRNAARTRALRAARAVALGWMASAVGGCALTVSGFESDASHDGSEVTVRADATPREDAGNDATDANDAGARCSTSGTDWEECCRRNGWRAELGCLAWGPFMPPEAQG